MRRVTLSLTLVLSFFLQTPHLDAGTIHGFIREKATGEPVYLANIWIKGTSIGTTSNMKGFYVLASLPPANYEIIFRYMGYKTFAQKFFLGENDDITLDVALESEILEMTPTVVTAEREKRDLDIKPGTIAVRSTQIKKLPQAAEPDLLRSVQMLPGVATLSDFSAGLYVRGGSADQNLILLDQIDVYNPNHMFGFFSTFNVDAVKSVELEKGGFPAMYGGRLSSVLNVLNRDGDREKFHGIARLSLLSTSATLEGPWKKGSWMFSGRRTYLELAGKMIKQDIPYYFYDAHAKLNYDIDKNNLASLSFYAGQDLLAVENDGMDIGLDWGNKTFSAQWTHLFSSNLYSHFVLAGSRFDSDTDVKFEDFKLGLSNEITDICTKASLSYVPNLRHYIDFGFEFKALDFDLNMSIGDTYFPNSLPGKYYSFYLQDNYKIGTFNIIQAGLRLNHYTKGQYTRLEPRLSIKRIFTENLSLTASYGQYTQYLNLVQQEGMSFADMWFPIDDTIEPGEVEHYVLGLKYDNLHNLSIEAEMYYKPYDNVVEYRTNQDDSEVSDEIKAEKTFYTGTGNSYGFDILVRNNFKGLEGWFGYSLSYTKKKMLEYNFGQEYYPTYDRRHTITMIENYHLSKKWNINVAFKLGSGQPYTEASGVYAELHPNGRVKNHYLNGEKNFYRLPLYHRLDLALYYSTSLWHKKLELYVQFINVYNQNNVWYRYYDLSTNPAERKDVNMLPFLPTFGFNIEF